MVPGLQVHNQLEAVIKETDEADKPKPKPAAVQKKEPKGPDNIETSSAEDMFAFSQIVASGGNVLKTADEMEQLEKQ